MTKILVTGNLGYIGSHTVRALLDEGYDDIIGIDNLHRGSMANNYLRTHITDIRNKDELRDIFKEVKPEVVLHFAALTSVPESMEKPDEYYEVNVEGTQNLIEMMKEFNCSTLIFSSTASLYKQSKEPVRETDVLQPLNNYARNKMEVEQLIRQNSDWLNAIIFRYFNVVGWSEEYDSSREIEKSNIVPSLIRAHMSGDKLKVYGNKYPITRKDPNDHTCVRDYIDVRDIANAYILALDYLKTHKGQEVFNLGTKDGASVLEIIKAFIEANNIELDYEIVEPRKGDPAIVVADNQKAKELLNWSPKYSLKESLKLL